MGFDGHTPTPAPAPGESHMHTPAPPPEEPQTQEQEPQTQEHTQTNHTTRTNSDRPPRQTQTPKYPIYATILNPDWRMHMDKFRAMDRVLGSQIEIGNGRSAGGSIYSSDPKL